MIPAAEVTARWERARQQMDKGGSGRPAGGR